MHASGIEEKPKSACRLPFFLKGREVVTEEKRHERKMAPSFEKFELLRTYIHHDGLAKCLRDGIR